MEEKFTDQEKAARKRHNALSRAYRMSMTGHRYVVEAIEPGRKYRVSPGGVVFADSCDNAMTNYLRNN